MSLKRYASLAAMSYQNSQIQLETNQNLTDVSNSTKKSTTFLSIMRNAFNQLNQLNQTIQNSTIKSFTIPPPTTTTQTTTINSYNGGIGLYHQQNIRANSGANSIIFLSNGGAHSSNGPSHNFGNGYPSVVNGNVNLLLGG